MSKVTKLVGNMTPAELTSYLVQHAAGTPYHRTTIMQAPITRGLTRLLKAYDDNRYIVTLILDRLLSVGWPGSERGVTESMVTLGVFDYALRDTGGSQQPWKYMYFKRFRETLLERDFFTYYLGALEDCQVRILGSQPANYPEMTWESKEQDAIIQLEAMVQLIQDRLDERGVLEEWPEIPLRSRSDDYDLREFINDPKRATLAPRRNDVPSTC